MKRAKRRVRKTRAFRSAHRVSTPGPRETFLADVAAMAGEIYDHAQAHIEAEAARVRQQALGAVRSLLEQKMTPALPAPRSHAGVRQERSVSSVAKPVARELGDHPRRQKNGKAPPLVQPVRPDRQELAHVRQVARPSGSDAAERLGLRRLAGSRGVRAHTPAASAQVQAEYDRQLGSCRARAHARSTRSDSSRR